MSDQFPIDYIIALEEDKYSCNYCHEVSGIQWQHQASKDQNQQGLKDKLQGLQGNYQGNVIATRILHSIKSSFQVDYMTQTTTKSATISFPASKAIQIIGHHFHKTASCLCNWKRKISTGLNKVKSWLCYIAYQVANNSHLDIHYTENWKELQTYSTDFFSFALFTLPDRYVSYTKHFFASSFARCQQGIHNVSTTGDICFRNSTMILANLSPVIPAITWRIVLDHGPSFWVSN